MRGLRLIPFDRILVETDHPFGDRSESGLRRPGNLAITESAFSQTFSVPTEAVRRRTWSNLKAMSEKIEVTEQFRRDFQVQFLTV
jgi:TatD DNase family protein